MTQNRKSNFFLIFFAARLKKSKCFWSFKWDYIPEPKVEQVDINGDFYSTQENDVKFFINVQILRPDFEKYLF